MLHLCSFELVHIRREALSTEILDLSLPSRTAKGGVGGRSEMGFSSVVEGTEMHKCNSLFVTHLQCT
jgi:hypothetical protein